MGGIVLSPTWITLLVVLKCFENHKTNSTKLKTFGMHSTFTKLIALRCLEQISYKGKYEYQLYALDQWNYLSILTKELNVSP